MSTRGYSHLCFVSLLLLFPCSGVPATGAASQGRTIAHDVYKGNCLACHRVPRDPDANTLANIGPPLVDMRARFPDRAELRAQIWDATKRNPESIMPPFGKHRILTETEIEVVIDYLYEY